MEGKGSPLSSITALVMLGGLLAAPVSSPDAAAPVPAITLDGATVKAVQEDLAPIPAWQIALDFAQSKRADPYVWGGTGDSGYDCSGLTLRAYEKAGIDLPRVTYDQYDAFDEKIAWKDLKPGDLVFFSNLGHMGMISKPGYMVHAPRSGDEIMPICPRLLKKTRSPGNLGHMGMISKPGYMVHAPRSGDVVKEEKLSAWRRQAFDGAVRPDPEGVKLSAELIKRQ